MTKMKKYLLDIFILRRIVTMTNRTRVAVGLLLLLVLGVIV